MERRGLGKNQTSAEVNIPKIHAAQKKQLNQNNIQ